MAMVLLCHVGDLLCALPVEHVVETLRPLPLEPLGTSELVRGVAIVRGTPVPVIDAGVALGRPRLTAARRWIVLRLDVRRAAMAVDEVVGVSKVTNASFAALDPLLAGRDHGSAAHGTTAASIQSLAAIDQALMVVLRAARLVPPAVFAALEEAPT